MNNAEASQPYSSITKTIISVLLASALVWKARSSRSVGDVSKLKSLETFQLKEVLKDEDDGRVVTLLGRFSWQGQNEQALVKLTATPLVLKALVKCTQLINLTLKSESGAEFAYYDGTIPAWKRMLYSLQGSKYSVSVIAPASERLINRHRPTRTVMVTETAELYASVTVPHIERVIDNGKSLAWIYNVLSSEKESERVLYEDNDQENGFILNVDTKWRTHPNMKDVEKKSWYNDPSITDLYCLALCHRRGVRTLRDLSGKDLPMLREIYRRGVETIRTTYGLPEDQLRVFVHYLPQFYHFHVHFTRLHNTIGAEAERAHLLLDIIQNLESDGDFYSKRTIQYRLSESDALCKALVREASLSCTGIAT